MLQAIENFFSWFKDTIDQLWIFFQGFLNGLINLFKMIPKAVSFITQFISTIPVPLQIFGTLTITVCVIYLILGRNTGGTD